MAKGAHTDPTRIHNSQWMCYTLKSEYIQHIPDDGAVAFGLQFDRPERDKRWGEPSFQLRDGDVDKMIDPANFQGGLVVISAIHPSALQRALMAGIQWLHQTGQLTCADFYDENGHDGNEEPNP